MQYILHQGREIEILQDKNVTYIVTNLREDECFLSQMQILQKELKEATKEFTITQKI